jgi:hypothetical protein
MVLCGIFMKTIISLNMNIFERNDIFLRFCYRVFSFSVGAEAGFNYLFFIGLGITAYGFCYFMIHDVLIHKDSNGLSLQTDTL